MFSNFINIFKIFYCDLCIEGAFRSKAA